MDYPIHDEEYYTTASYENYRSAFQEAQEIQEKWFARPSSVGRSKQKLQDALDCLAETTQGVYRIDWEFNLQFNNFVGSDWHHEIFCDGKPWHQGDTITANPNSYVTVRGVVQEIDKISDCGEEMLQLMLAEDVSDSVLITVEENAGRYKGNQAGWVLQCSVVLVERI